MRIGKPITKILSILRPHVKKHIEDGELTVRLKGALYGLKESSSRWYDTLSKVLIGLGYTMSKEDRCVFTKMNGDTQTSLLLHVDDMLVSSKSKPDLIAFKNALQKKFQIEYQEGDTLSLLGLVIKINRKDKNIHVSNSTYVDMICKDNNTNGTASTPAGSRFLEPTEGKLVDKNLYLSKVMKLMYVAKRTRPISYSQHQQSLFTQTHPMQHTKTLRATPDTQYL